MQGVRLYTPSGSIAATTTSGIFARVLMEQLPQLPMEEDVELGDPFLRDRFLVRVYTYFRWQQLARQRLTSEGLREFHKRHKDFITPGSPETSERLEQLLLDSSRTELEINARVYIARLMEALKKAP